MVMEASPASPFEVGEAEFALEFLIVALDAPAQFRRIDEGFDRRILRLIFYTSDPNTSLKRLISLDRMGRNCKNVVPRFL
jgi:hypothetical protein